MQYANPARDLHDLHSLRLLITFVPDIIRTEIHIQPGSHSSLGTKYNTSSSVNFIIRGRRNEKTPAVQATNLHEQSHRAGCKGSDTKSSIDLVSKTHLAVREQH